MRVLVAYGSKRGGTEGIAIWIAEELCGHGLPAEALPAGKVKRLDNYDAVIVGGSLYATRWHRQARRFVRQYQGELRRIPTYFFSSGPLDDSASRRDIPPVTGVKRLMDLVGARGHVTFGGRLSADARGFPASAMAKKMSGDWRDRPQVETWARTVAAHLLDPDRAAA
jgi:menaquinone-dependent protoporphyrinogen oxidase